MKYVNSYVHYMVYVSLLGKSLFVAFGKSFLCFRKIFTCGTKYPNTLCGHFILAIQSRLTSYILYELFLFSDSVERKLLKACDWLRLRMLPSWSTRYPFTFCLIFQKPKNRITNRFFLLKTEIYTQILNTKPFLFDIRGPKYLQNKIGFLIR